MAFFPSFRWDSYRTQSLVRLVFVAHVILTINQILSVKRPEQNRFRKRKWRRADSFCTRLSSNIVIFLELRNSGKRN